MNARVLIPVAVVALVVLVSSARASDPVSSPSPSASTTPSAPHLESLALPGAPGGPTVDAHALGEEMAGALVKTEALAESEILSEVVSSGYRIGLVLKAGEPIRPRAASGRFIPPSAPDADITFVGVVLREARTLRFLPSANVQVTLEFDPGGGDDTLDELTGPYPVYGKDLRLPRAGGGDAKHPQHALTGIGVRVGPPAYNRHAEMLTPFTGRASAHFSTVAIASAKKPPLYTVADAKKPGPPPSDWKIGDDLRQAAGEARAWTRDGEFAIGFVSEGPEPIWLWQGEGQPPRHCPVAAADTNHFELIAIHMPTGLSVTAGEAGVRFWRRGAKGQPPETHDFLLRPLLADFYHYGLTAPLPPGTWVVRAGVVPPGMAAWGTSDKFPLPEGKIGGMFQFTRDAAVTGPVAEAERFSMRVTAAGAKYGTGDRKAATREVVDAFFDFEGSALDRQVRVSDPGAYKSLESDWIALRTRMEAHEDPAAIATAAEGVAAQLKAIAAPGAPGAGSSAFVQSFFVLLREGFEAILVLGLLVAVLKKTGKTESLKLVWGGALAAVVASLGLAAAGAVIFRGVGAAKEAFEGITLLISVAVLFFTSFWLISRVEGRRWALFVKREIEDAISGGNKRWAIASLAFLVVFREGAETVLFYAGLFASAHGAVGPIVGGIAAASVALALIFWAQIVGGAKLPVRPFFAITGALLYLLAFKFAGDALAELQSAGWIAATRVSFIPSSPALAAWLGIRATMETSIAQGVLLAAVAAGLAWTFLRRAPGDAPGTTGGAVA